MKTARVLILGKSNVGKSSLINHLKNNHTALVSNKLHSSRVSTSHSFNYHNLNIELIDTPGASIENTNLLSQAMKSHASKYITNSDVIILLTQPQKKYTYEMKIASQIKDCKKKYILCVNKIDLDIAETFKQRLSDELQTDQYISISVKSSLGINNLLSKLDTDIKKNKNTANLIKDKKNQKNILQELIRESVFNITNQEIPYESAVCLKEIDTKKNICMIKADIIVSKHNHKKIIIGKKGEMIKKLGSISRQKIESYLNKKIHLSLFVVIRENWKNDSSILKDLGYID